MSESQRLMPAVIVALVVLVMVFFGLYIAEVIKSPQSSSDSNEPALATSDEIFHWKLVTTWPKNFPGLGTAPETFATMVNEMSNGRLQIKVHGAGELVPALGVFDAVSSGSVQMGHGASYYWKGKVAAAVFYTTVPFGMNAQETSGWINFGGGMELWREIYEPFNLIPFQGGNTGVQMGGWYNTKIESIDDIKGVKMRIPGLGGEVWSRAGGVSVTLAGNELYTSLQTGVIDATEWVGPYNDLAMGFHQVAKYYYYPGWHEPGAMLEFIVNKDAYATLPEDLQAIVETATVAANQLMLDQFTGANNASLKELTEVHGVELLAFPDDVLKELKTISADVYRDISAKNPQFAKVYQSYLAFQEQVSQYHLISEEAYYKTRHQ